MKLRALIVDDEAPARDRLRRLLAGDDRLEVVGEAENGAQAVARVEELRPDLVFLDIQMPGLDGFEVIEALRDPPGIVFVTAYDEYALRAFEVHALDYLLKPVSRERLEQAVARAYESWQEEQDFAARLGSLLESLGQQGRYLQRLAVRGPDRILVLDVAEVDWIGAERGAVVVHRGEQAHVVNRSLAELEARLDPARFFRAHRSAIVNLDRVREIIPWFAGSHRVRLAGGAEVELSRSRAKTLRQLLEW